MRQLVVVKADEQAIPAPDGAVVQAQVSIRLDRPRYFDRQQHRIIRQILGETRRRVGTQVARAESHPHMLWMSGVTAIDGLLEERHARFMPECALEQERRIGGQRQQRRSENQRRVIGTRRFAGRRLQMHLERCGRRFEHHVGVRRGQVFDAGNIERQRPTATEQ
ncbi:MAG: hypothetical protein AW09_003236 [Candidatus Accumulibacter phosphatis]|uniref:Uncharacterized protein n=1 Tax=Candidatus Accumulibacter phosphatis TaxID=327160 RepID=A0A080LT60_9PROT|nr:MAG: hypothetical protein AW09_003236 [Candidatus Accumulibacter phosphatis]